MRYRYIPQKAIRVAYDCGVHFHYDRAEAERCWWWQHRPHWGEPAIPPRADTALRATIAEIGGQDVRLIRRYLRALAK